MDPAQPREKVVAGVTQRDAVFRVSEKQLGEASGETEKKKGK